MELSLKPRHLKRYKDVVRLFLKYGRGDMAGEFEKAGVLAAGEGPTAGKPEELARELEDLGPTFVKIGQLLSSRADLVPPAYLSALARLQDDVKPFAIAEVEAIVQDELGTRISKAFASFERVPLAAASLGQVHAAALRDGRPVVVKVQRPGIRDTLVEDFEALGELASFLDGHTRWGRRYRLHKIVDELRSAVMQELDYEREASHLITLAGNLEEFKRIRVPLPVPDYTARRVLTMEYVHGTKITKLNPLVKIDIDGESLADELFRAYLKQVLVDGFFHADPHPGNVFLTEDHRIALLDLGMVGRMTPWMQQQALKLLLAVSEGNSDVAIEIALRISDTDEEFDEDTFRHRVAQLVVGPKDEKLASVDLGKSLLDLTRASADSGVFVPTSLTLIGKTLLQLHQIGMILAPDFNPHAAVRRNASRILRKQLGQSVSSSNLLSPILELKEFLAGLPGRLNRIMDALGGPELEVKVKTPDAEHVLKGFQRLANRLTAGLILAALIVGASLLMQVPTSFRIFGYPGLAMLFFLGAAGGGVWLMLHVAWKDSRDRRNVKR